MSYFPILRLLSLCITQISLPISIVLRIAAERNRPFRNYVVMPPARFYVWCEMKVFLMIQGPDTKFIPPPKHDMIRLGSSLVSEVTMLVLLSVFMSMTYYRKIEKAKTMEESIETKIESSKNEVREMILKEERQRVELSRLQRAINKIRGTDADKTQNN